ncbi:MAG TPA: hypothetical protein VIA18_20945, partial [Polyangia bacterium]|nr:hypothetical protein [Polyangia bacterium]
MSPRPFRAAFVLAFAAAGCAAVATAAVDVLVTCVRASSAVGGGALVSVLVAALGLYGFAAAIFAFGAAIVGGGMWATFDVPAATRRWLDGVRRDDDYDRAHAGGLIAAAAALGLVGALVLVYDLRVALEMAAKRNSALSTAMVAIMTVPIAALAWFPLYRLARAIVSPLPRPRTLIVLGALVAVALLAVVGAVLSVDWRVIDFGPAEAFLVFVILSFVFAWILARTQLVHGARGTILVAGGWA